MNERADNSCTEEAEINLTIHNKTSRAPIVLVLSVIGL